MLKNYRQRQGSRNIEEANQIDQVDRALFEFLTEEIFRVNFKSVERQLVAKFRKPTLDALRRQEKIALTKTKIGVVQRAIFSVFRNTASTVARPEATAFCVDRASNESFPSLITSPIFPMRSHNASPFVIIRLGARDVKRFSTKTNDSRRRDAIAAGRRQTVPLSRNAVRIGVPRNSQRSGRSIRREFHTTLR